MSGLFGHDESGLNARLEPSGVLEVDHDDR
jgi:hypothetical protein